MIKLAALIGDDVPYVVSVLACYYWQGGCCSQRRACWNLRDDINKPFGELLAIAYLAWRGLLLFPLVGLRACRFLKLTVYLLFASSLMWMRVCCVVRSTCLDWFCASNFQLYILTFPSTAAIYLVLFPIGRVRWHFDKFLGPDAFLFIWNQGSDIRVK